MVFNEEEFLASYPQIAPASAGDGHPGHLTPDQKKALDHLRELVHAQGYKERTDDATLLRFLRARRFEVAKAHQMYTECEEWRKEYGTNTILEDFHFPEREQVLELYPKYYYKSDREGRPVYYEEIGHVDVTKLLKVTTKDKLVRELVREYEAFIRYRLPACSREVGYLVETSCTVVDLKGVSLSSARHVYPFISDAATIGQNYYPERMGKFYIINAPWGFSAVWAFVKKFLDPVTVEKIHILNHKYQSELAKQIPPQNLPVEFGGKSKSEGPIYLADDGPWQDERFIGPERHTPNVRVAGSKEATAAAAAAMRHAAEEPVDAVDDDDARSFKTAPA